MWWFRLGPEDRDYWARYELYKGWNMRSEDFVSLSEYEREVLNDEERADIYILLLAK